MSARLLSLLATGALLAGGAAAEAAPPVSAAKVTQLRQQLRVREATIRSLQARLLVATRERDAARRQVTGLVGPMETAILALTPEQAFGLMPALASRFPTIEQERRGPYRASVSRTEGSSYSSATFTFYWSEFR